MNWTQRDEKRWSELQTEVQKLEQRRFKAREELETILSRMYDRDIERVSVDLLIKHADAMRDALAPFDSGIRASHPA